MEVDVDLKLLNQLLVEKMRVKRRPVAITYCPDGPPPGYEPVNIVRLNPTSSFPFRGRIGRELSHRSAAHA